MVTATTSADTSGAEKKFLALERDILKGADESLETVGDAGKQFARSKAPYLSGQTFRKIKLLRGDGMEVKIVATNILHDGHKRKFARFDLTRWMHQSPRARSHIKSGDPKFMYATAAYLRRLAPVTVQKRYNRLLLKYR